MSDVEYDRSLSVVTLRGLSFAVPCRGGLQRRDGLKLLPAGWTCMASISVALRAQESVFGSF